MSRFGIGLLALAASLPLLTSSGVAHAYDAENTHRWIARKAAELLVATYPGEYDEVLEFTDDLVQGAFHEDDFFLDGDDDPKTLRVMRHFFNPETGKGLTFDGRTFPSAYEWNAIGSEQNEWDYHDALLAYQKGNLADAYFIAGHTVHLISDVTVPAHSHLDDHGPPFGDTYENYCASRSLSPTESSLRTPKPGAAIPEFLDLKDAFRKTARSSYYRNLYPGNLDGDSPTGVIAEMFPSMSKGFFSGTWQIDGVGTLGSDFYEEIPGYFYFKKNNVTSRADVLNYDPMAPLDRVYGAIASDAPMVERMADDLVPVAILNSAAVLKMFVDEARALPSLADPTVAAANGDTAGCNVSPGASPQSGWSLLFILIPLFFRRKQIQVQPHV